MMHINSADSRRRRGRPSSTQAPDALRGAAQNLFLQNGFTATSLRDIARAASVDPALVVRHFGSKVALFLEVMDIGSLFKGITDAPMDRLGHTILERLIVDAPNDQSQAFTVVMRALDRPEVRRDFSRATEVHISEPLARRLTGEDADTRARLVVVQIVGLLLTLGLSDDGELPKASTSSIVKIYADALQALIDGGTDLAESGQASV